MKKQFAKPENWQDFESLCKILWGEIWVCPEIKKNGRSGQAQHGVDVYGVPQGESNYYGIQCKGKDDYSKSKLTAQEIDEEVNNAKNFKPSLKKLYFATTANKDSVIEEYIREKDLANRSQGSFEIHLFSWEDIVDLIDENKRTFDWYIKNINFKTSYNAQILFDNGESELKFSPTLIRNTVTYKFEKFTPPSLPGQSLGELPQDHFLKLEQTTEPQPVRYYMYNEKSVNKSSCVFALGIKNIGNTAIKNYKLYFEISGGDIQIDTVNKATSFADFNNYKYYTYLNEGALGGVFEPDETILVQKDSIISDDICFRPNNDDPMDLEVNWQLVSEDFDCDGSLSIKLTSEIIERETLITDNFRKNGQEVIFQNYWE